MGIRVNSTFTPSANVLTEVNKVRGMLCFRKRYITGLAKEIFVPLGSSLVRPYFEYVIQTNSSYLKKGINHLERTQMAPKRWVKRYRDLIYEERLKAQKRLRNDPEMALTHKITYNQINLEAVELLKFSRGAGLRRSSNQENPKKEEQFYMQDC